MGTREKCDTTAEIMSRPGILTHLIRWKWNSNHEYGPGLVALEIQTFADLAPAHCKQQSPSRYSAVVLFNGLGEVFSAPALLYDVLQRA